MADTFSKLASKRIQFHIDSATALPLPKPSGKAPITYVSVKITDIKDRLKTSVVKGQKNPIWQQNLTPTRLSAESEVTFEVKQRSLWPTSTTPLARTDPYPLSTLLKMQGGNTFGTNIELPLHPATKTHVPGAGSLTVNIRELSSIETAQLCWEMAEKMSNDMQRVEEHTLAPVLNTAL